MKLAIWYHCRLAGGSVPIDTEAACRILASQMRVLKDSGLLKEADEFHVGVNGGHDDAEIVRVLSPCLKVDIREHGPKATTEIATLKWLQDWLPAHRDWFVLYFHSKGRDAAARRIPPASPARHGKGRHHQLAHLRQRPGAGL